MQASSFSGGPHELSNRACPQELLPNYQLGPDGRRGASCPPHPTSSPSPSCAPAHLHLCLRHLSGCRSLPCPDVARLLLPPALRFLPPAPASISSPPEGHPPPPPSSAGHPCLGACPSLRGCQKGWPWLQGALSALGGRERTRQSPEPSGLSVGDLASEHGLGGFARLGSELGFSVDHSCLSAAPFWLLTHTAGTRGRGLRSSHLPGARAALAKPCFQVAPAWSP